MYCISGTECLSRSSPGRQGLKEDYSLHGNKDVLSTTNIVFPKQMRSLSFGPVLVVGGPPCSVVAVVEKARRKLILAPLTHPILRDDLIFTKDTPINISFLSSSVVNLLDHCTKAWPAQLTEGHYLHFASFTAVVLDHTQELNLHRQLCPWNLCDIFPFC